MLLEIKDLWVHYGRAEALRGVSIQVPEGSVVTLLGANGAGKTTTLRTVSGLKRATSGEIWYEGERIDSLPPHEIVRRGIAHVPEGRQLFYSLTVKQNLMMGGFLLKGRAQFSEKLGGSGRAFPQPERPVDPSWVRPERGRAADGSRRQGAHVQSEALAHGRTEHRSESDHGERGGQYRAGRSSKLGVTVVLVEQNARMALRLANTAYVLEVGRITLSGEAAALGQGRFCGRPRIWAGGRARQRCLCGVPQHKGRGSVGHACDRRAEMLQVRFVCDVVSLAGHHRCRPGHGQPLASCTTACTSIRTCASTVGRA